MKIFSTDYPSGANFEVILFSPKELREKFPQVPEGDLICLTIRDKNEVEQTTFMTPGEANQLIGLFCDALRERHAQ